MAKLETLVVAILLVLLLLSAGTVVYSKYRTRLLFIEIEKQGRLLEQYEVEWGQMQLELTMLADQNRVEQNAVTHLHMGMPQRDKIIYIKP
jgi:cell division protein FtsL